MGAHHVNSRGPPPSSSSPAPCARFKNTSAPDLRVNKPSRNKVWAQPNTGVILKSQDHSFLLLPRCLYKVNTKRTSALTNPGTSTNDCRALKIRPAVCPWNPTWRTRVCSMARKLKAAGDGTPCQDRPWVDLLVWKILFLRSSSPRRWTFS